MLNLPVSTPWSLNPPISTPKPTNLHPLWIQRRPLDLVFCSEGLLGFSLLSIIIIKNIKYYRLIGVTNAYTFELQPHSSRLVLSSMVISYCSKSNPINWMDFYFQNLTAALYNMFSHAVNLWVKCGLVGLQIFSVFFFFAGFWCLSKLNVCGLNIWILKALCFFFQDVAKCFSVAKWILQ